MQFRQFFFFVTFSVFLLGAGQANAQKITTNEDGEKIIVYPDGSWKYFNNTTETPIEEEIKGEEVKSKAELKAEKKQERLQRKLEKQQQAQTKKKSPKKKKGKVRADASSVSKTSAYEAVDEEEDRDRQDAIRQAELAAAAEAEAKRELDDSSLKLSSYEAELKAANDYPDTTIEELEELKEKVSLAKAEEKEAKANYKASRKRARQLEKMIDLSKEKRDKAMAKMDIEKIEEPKGSNRKRQKGNEVFVDEAFQNTTPYIAPKKTFAVYKPENDVMINPPAHPCELTFDGVDEFSGKTRRDVARQNLFVHTSDQLRPYFKDREYITCNGYLSAISGGYKLLYLHFDILSENAQREFGALEKGSILSIKFIDGSTIKLANSKTDRGILNTLEKSVSYRGQYIISASSEKALRKNEVDKVRVVWGTGYEDYEVYDLDFFVNQFNCLNGN